MPFNRPSLSELDNRNRTNISSRLPGADSSLRRTNIAVFARALAGQAHGQYGYMDWMTKQIFPDTAEVEMLDRHAAIRGLSRKAAAKASGPVIFSGEENAFVPAGTLLTRSDGVEFTTDEEIVILGDSSSGTVTAVNSGSASATAAETILTFVSPQVDIDSNAVVDVSGLANGADEETDESLRARILKRWRQPPQGGAKHDYEDWALQVPGVSRVWVSPGEFGLGTVTVRYVRDQELDIFPDEEHRAIVKAYIDTLRPVASDVYVEAPTPKDLDLTIGLNPLTEAAKQAVIAELNDLLLREATPGAKIYLSKIREAVSNAVGENDNAVTAPSEDAFHSLGEMARLGTITWEGKS